MRHPETGETRGDLAADTRPQRVLSGSWTQLTVPWLTVLFHDDHRRVGEVAMLGSLISGEPVQVSRLEPIFSLPGGVRHPLADPHLSRTPFYLRLESEGILLDCRDTSTPVIIDRRPVEGTAYFSFTDLQRGIVLQLANSIVLLLHLRDPVPERAGADFGLVGQSEALVQLRRDIERVAPLDVPVLLRGETGTGKEMVARALHEHGPRKGEALVTVNMAAIPPTLAASELFGAVKGAFTGAVGSREGHFERAHGGTLFLDEIGETPTEIQPLLLRALETGEIQRIGQAQPRKVDVRLVAATDVDLERHIAEGRFRAPLLHRLSGFGIFLPPLRARLDDLGLLLFHFLRQGLREMGQYVPDHQPVSSVRPWLRASVVALLAEHPWPGNVRELRNVVRQLLIIARDARPKEVLRRARQLLESGTAFPEETSGSTDTLTVETPVPPETPAPGRFRKASEIDEDELLEALKANRWLFQPTARALGISRTALYRRIDKSPRVRKPSQLSHEELTAALSIHGDDLESMAEALQVSEKGLGQRLRQLGLV